MNREKEIYKTTLIGGAANVLLLVFKFVAGILGHSAAMVADAVHSLSDFVTDVIVLLFVKISGKPKDRDHNYGHGKYETLASTLIGLALLAVAIGILVSGAVKIAAWLQGEELQSPGVIAFWAAIVSIACKEAVYQYTIRKSIVLDSSALKANAWHHRSDALSSIGTAMGIAGAVFLGHRWAVLDPLASIVVGAFIVKVAVQMLKEGIDNLMEKSLPSSVEEEVLSIVAKYPDVADPHNMKTRSLGSNYAIELHIRMDGGKTLNETHARASQIEDDLKERFGEHTHVSIHVEPIK